MSEAREPPPHRLRPLRQPPLVPLERELGVGPARAHAQCTCRAHVRGCTCVCMHGVHARARARCRTGRASRAAYTYEDAHVYTCMGCMFEHAMHGQVERLERQPLERPARVGHRRVERVRGVRGGAQRARERLGACAIERQSRGNQQVIKGTSAMQSRGNQDSPEAKTSLPAASITRSVGTCGSGGGGGGGGGGGARTVRWRERRRARGAEGARGRAHRARGSGGGLGREEPGAPPFTSTMHAHVETPAMGV